MEVEWHPIKSERDLPRPKRWVLVTTRGKVDVSEWYRNLRGGISWLCYPDPSAWADLPKPYKKPKRKL